MQERTLVATQAAIYLDCLTCGLPALFKPFNERLRDGCSERLTRIAPMMQQTVRADNELDIYYMKRLSLVHLFDNLGLTQLSMNQFLVPHWLQGATLSFEESDKIAYAVDLQDTFNSTLRRKVRFSKFLDRLLSTGVLPSMPDTQAAQLCQEWARLTSLIAPKFTFSIESGAAITEAYLKGPNTCMSGSNSSIQLYAKNPEKVSLLRIATKNNPFHGRALLWNLDNGQRFLDRIYPDDGGIHIELAQNYAKKQGWLWRKGGLTHTTVYNPDASKHDNTLSVSLRNCKAWPYMDTLIYLINYEEGDCQIELRNKANNSSFIALHETNGVLPELEEEEEEEGEEDSRPICDRCEELIDTVNLHTVCHSRGCYDVYYCEHCESILSFCTDCSHTMFESHAYNVVDRSGENATVCWCCIDTCYIRVVDTYYHTTLVDSCITNDCSGYVLKESDTHLLCQTCFDAKQTHSNKQRR